MENNFNFENLRKNGKPEDPKEEKFNDNADNNKTEEEISSSYLKDLDLQGDLENQMVEEFSKTNNSSLRESILELRKAGEEKLKEISSKVVEIFNSNKLTVRLRDNYVEKRGKRICTELNAKNNLSKAEDYDRFLKTLSSEFWGSSSKADDAISNANRALEVIIERFPEKTEEILNIWPKLLSKDDLNGSAKKGLEEYLNKIIPNTWSDSGEREEKLKKYVESESDFVSLKALSRLSKEQFEKDSSGKIFSRLDSIISQFPNSKKLPNEIKSLLLDTVSKNPDELLSDSRRVDFVFNLWLNDLKGSPDYNFKGIFPLLINRLSNCSENETKEMLEVLNKQWGRYSYLSEDWNWLLDAIPLEKKDLRPFLKSAENGAVKSHIISIKEDELSGQKISDENFKVMLEETSRMSSGNELIFISNLINKYPNENYGINSEMVGQMLDSLASRDSDRFDIEKIHALNELMSRCNWPDSLKEKVFSLSNIRSDSILKILDKQDEKTYAWAKNEPLLWHQLQLDFHKNAYQNDLRHYFYEVLDGSRQSDDLDDLIKSYAASQNRLDFEEIRSLLLDGRIDKKYIKYFICKVDVDDILYGLQNNSINPEDTKLLLEATVKYGPVENASKALRKILSLEDYQSPDKRQELIDAMSENLISKVDEHGNSAKAEMATRNIANDIFFSNGNLEDFLSEEEVIHLARKIMEGALSLKSDYDLTSLTLACFKKISDFFPNMDKNNKPINDREEYLTKLFERLLPGDKNNHYYMISRAYFSGLDLEISNEATRHKIEQKLLELRALDHPDFIHDFDELNEKQREEFLNYFEKNYSIENNGRSSDGRHNLSYICQSLNEKQLDNIRQNQTGLERIYLKLLNDKDLDSSSANTLFNEGIIFGNDDIRNAFFSNLNNWPGVNGAEILEAAASRKSPDELNDKNEIIKKGFSLTPEEIKTISTATMNTRGLSPRFWKNYLSSGGQNGDFYLDENLFRIGLKNVSEDCFAEEAGDIISFMKSLEESKFGTKKEDIERIISGSFANPGKGKSSRWERLESFYAYAPEFIEKEIFDKNYHSSMFKTLFEGDINYSSDFKDKITEYVFKDKINIDYFIDYLKRINDQESINKVKQHLNGMEDNDYKVKARLSLLNHDLLNVEESRDFYKEMTVTSKDNVRTQILNSIDVISSMLSNRNNLEQLGSFLDDPRPEYTEDLKEISDFIEKYKKENKGRSIVVMLFAREYLPDRKIEDVIDRVSYNLRKYQEVVEKNSYDKIPEGLHASIGMEYEITSSTASGYQELTSQSSLKDDIARLSNAARIGSGRDAVHEIATRPTDNPYLMLLEMKLLHDIEYIDLNFNRSENYQKGARGFHLTIGGEKGISVNQESNFLQNAIIAASWGGVQAGESGHKVNGGRGVSLRGRSRGDSNNIAFFKEATDSVELRSLSIDKQETLQRAVTTAFNGAIAIQAFRECFPDGSEKALEMLSDETKAKNLQEMIKSKDEKTAQLANLWLELLSKVDKAVKNHNSSFLDRETFGYLDNNNVWVDVSDFGGEYNQKRFQSIIENIDPTLSLKEYIKTTEINREELFKSFSIDLSDKLIKVNNLYLKPGTSTISKEGKESSVFKGDNTNAASMLETTRFNNNDLEYYDNEFLDKTVFDTAGEKRSGYYTLQGGSELMLTHAVQKALLEFNAEIEKIVR